MKKENLHKIAFECSLSQLPQNMCRLKVFNTNFWVTAYAQDSAILYNPAISAIKSNFPHLFIYHLI